MKPEIIDQLLREADDLQKKLDAVHAMLAAYGHKVPAKQMAAPAQPSNKTRSTTDKTQKVRERCLPLITAQNGIPMKTKDILEVLKGEGYEIGGKNEVATLSAMLSNSGEFKAIGRSGWVLKQDADQQEQVVTNESAPTRGG